MWMVLIWVVPCVGLAASLSTPDPSPLAWVCIATWPVLVLGHRLFGR